MLPDDTRNIPEPKTQEMNFGHDAYNKIITHQAGQSLDFARQLRHVFGKPRQALNVDRFDEVQDSSWFTNRNAYRPLSLEDIARGPDTGQGPDTTQSWTVTQAKLEGVTPGFYIKDSRGDRYVINGTKSWPSHAGSASVYLTVCTTDPEAGDEGIAIIYVPHDAEGLSFGKPEPKMGFRTSMNATVYYDNVRVP